MSKSLSIFNRIFTLTIIGALTGSIAAIQQPTSPTKPVSELNYLSKIKEEHFKSMGLEPERKTPPPFLIKSGREALNLLFGKGLIYTPAVFSDHEKRKLVFAIIEPNQQKADAPHVISFTTAKKLELVSNSGTNSSDHMVHRLSSTIDHANKITSAIHTEAGRVNLIKQISHPHTDTKLLAKSQSIINSLARDITLLSKVTHTLQKMSTGENDFLSFYQPYRPVNIETLDSFFTSWPFEFMNKTANRIEFMQLCSLNTITQIMLIPEYAFACGALARYLFKEEEIGTGLMKGGAIAAIPWNMVMLSTLKAKGEITYTLQQLLINVATYVNGAKELYGLMHNNSTFTQHFSLLKELETLVHPSKQHSAEFNELIELLGTKTFQGKASYFSRMGRVLRAYKLMDTESVRNEFAAMVRAIGELDTYCTLAQKVQQTAGEDIRYSFVEFDTKSATPYIQAIDLWNPFVPESKAIANTIEMGSDKPRNIILSGPNTGGKSTLTKGVLLNLILAQTFGIAAAKRMKFTPFENLDCFLNMTDDSAGGVSGWQAEVNRAEAIVQAITSKPNGFHFVLLDEIFTATSPDQAENTAVKFIKYLSELPNCMFIDAAHFDGIKDFAEKSKNCKNYHMGAITDPNGKILKYTYKLAEGRSTVKNATQVATATGKLSFLQEDTVPAA